MAVSEYIVTPRRVNRQNPAERRNTRRWGRWRAICDLPLIWNWRCVISYLIFAEIGPNSAGCSQEETGEEPGETEQEGRRRRSTERWVGRWRWWGWCMFSSNNFHTYCSIITLSGRGRQPQLWPRWVRYRRRDCRNWQHYSVPVRESLKNQEQMEVHSQRRHCQCQWEGLPVQ